MTSGTQITTLKTGVGVYTGDGGLQPTFGHEGSPCGVMRRCS